MLWRLSNLVQDMPDEEHVPPVAHNFDPATPPKSSPQTPLPDARSSSDEEPQSQARAPVVRQIQERSHRWGGFGMFHLNWEGPEVRPPHGAWQAVCPYHKLSSRTMCTKSYGAHGPTESDIALALSVVKHWCLLATKFDRKRAHGAIRVHSNFPMLSPEVLESRVMNMPPPPDPENLLDDYTLDFAQGREDSEAEDDNSDSNETETDHDPRHAGTGRPKGKAKPKAAAKAKEKAAAKAKSKGKAKGKAKPKAQPEAKGKARAAKAQGTPTQQPWQH